MKIVTKTYKVYEYNELIPNIQNKIINDHINWIINHIPYEKLSGNMKKAVTQGEVMQTPWFTGSYIYEYCLDEILLYLTTQNYLCNGDIFNE